MTIADLSPTEGRDGPASAVRHAYAHSLLGEIMRNGAVRWGLR